MSKDTKHATFSRVHAKNTINSRVTACEYQVRKGLYRNLFHQVVNTASTPVSPIGVEDRGGG